MSSYSLSYQTAVSTTVCAGLACHLIFKRYEPSAPSAHLGLLVVVPALLTRLFIPHCLNFAVAFTSCFSIYVSSLVVSILAYRLGPHHPLAEYPGPMMGKLSKLWMSYICCTTGKQHIYYRSLHDRYGDIVRIGPNELSFRDAAVVNPMMGNPGLPKGPVWKGRAPAQKTKMLITLSGPEHAHRRHPWNKAFNTEALKGYEEIIQKRANQLVDALGKQVGPTNLAMWIGYFAFDLMSDMAFGGGSEMLHKGDKDGVLRALDNSTTLMTAMGHSPWVGQYHNILPVGSEKRRFRDFCVNRAKIRMRQGSMTKDVFHYLLNEDGSDANPPSPMEAISDSVLVIIAGSDTTSTVLSSLFWFIVCNPATYRRLQGEIDAMFPPGVIALDTAKHLDMHYLNAVINETLRLFPAVLSGSQRVVDKRNGAVAFGSQSVKSRSRLPFRMGDRADYSPSVIPEGTAVFAHFYSMHRDPRYFSPLPDTFWPDRWLPEDERTSPFSPTPDAPDAPAAVDVVLDRTAFVPFSVGPSSCVGKNIALQEIRAVVCLVLQAFDMRFAEGYDAQRWEEEIEDRLVSHTGELPVVLTPRKT